MKMNPFHRTSNALSAILTGLLLLTTGCQTPIGSSSGLGVTTSIPNPSTMMRPEPVGTEQPSHQLVSTASQQNVGVASQTGELQPQLGQSTHRQYSATPPQPTSSTRSPIASEIGGNHFSDDTGQEKLITMRAQSPQINDPNVQPAAFQNPEIQRGGSFGQFPSINTGAPNEPNLFNGTSNPGLATFPMNYADVDIYLSETQTGRINFGGAYNSDNGIVGQFVIDERNFDILAFPRSFQEILDGTAWRGAGQTFRLELVPGAQVQRYLVSFGEPYLLDTNVSFNFSAYLFDRNYFDWDEQRVGARIALGYRLSPFLSVSAGIRAENVDISDPRVATSPQLNGVVGDTDLYVGHVGLVRDTRDHPFLATQGTYLSMTFHQAFGEFDYPRGDIDFRRYRLLYERPDGSGRHTLSYGTKLGVSGSQTPVFENYFAGGFSSMRGFDFRGASPVEGGVRVGGSFQWLNSLEYMFPMTADDMVKGVLFCDFGTVEDSVTINSENFRVAPGFGFRIHMPAAGIGAPLAFDFAFPVSSADGDEEQVFSFYLGVNR